MHKRNIYYNEIKIAVICLFAAKEICSGRHRRSDRVLRL